MLPIPLSFVVLWFKRTGKYADDAAEVSARASLPLSCVLLIFAIWVRWPSKPKPTIITSVEMEKSALKNAYTIPPSCHTAHFGLQYSLSWLPKGALLQGDLSYMAN